MSSLRDLSEEGQSVWLDYIRRSLIDDGTLAGLVAEGIRGVTSNPSIFEQAITGSDDYAGALGADVAAYPQASPEERYERLAVADIRAAADVLAPVYGESGGADGFVSLEVSPHLARDTEGTIAAARRLWADVGRPNLMIKVPATPEGIPAVEALIADGINVNVTLIFSLGQYEAQAEAYLRGLERAEHPGSVASVASFFVSRVDTAVDRLLDEHGGAAAEALRGTIAVANAKAAYARYRELFESDAFAPLRARGARPQRPLWASTGTKDPAYSDVKYVEELIGPNTVNTAPPATIDAFRDHGTVRGVTLLDDIDGARRALAGLPGAGIDLDAVTDDLLEAGVKAFADAYDRLLEALGSEIARLRAENAQAMSLGALDRAVSERIGEWRRDDAIARLWAKDHTLWKPDPEPEITDRLGWLTLPETMRPALGEIAAFADEVRDAGIRHVVLLGMGGSSLAPEVFARTLAGVPDRPRLLVLDSTHPDAVLAVEQAIDPAATLFLVASKSGTTIEPLSFFRYFWARVSQVTDTPGAHFAAITDPGTSLGDLARARGFRKVFEAIPDVGGRFSALTHFGLVPAAVIGADVGGLLDRAAVPAAAPESAAALGAALGEAARAGRDKATFFTSPLLDALPAWMEQLIAESTGKEGTGILPVAGEPITSPDGYGDDRIFVYLAWRGEDDARQSSALDALEAAGHPVVRITVDGPAGLAAEMYRAEIATAMAGAVLGINPFDQPNVQAAKALASQAMAGDLEAGSIPEVAADDPGLRASIDEFLASAQPGDYLAIQAFLAAGASVEAALQRGRIAARDRLGLATTLGFGPRFLHSTGQLHKGGPNTGLFLQVVDDTGDRVPVPETDYGFGRLVAAQADGDHQALVTAGRRVLRVRLGADADAGLRALAEAMAG